MVKQPASEWPARSFELASDAVSNIGHVAATAFFSIGLYDGVYESTGGQMTSSTLALLGGIVKAVFIQKEVSGTFSQYLSSVADTIRHN